MKIIIEHRGVKRVIEGPFNVCGSREDLRAIAAQLRGLPDDSSYGWVEVRTVAEGVTANQLPVGWLESAPPQK